MSKTTIAGILAAAGAIVIQLGYGLDDNPQTVTNWDVVMKSVGAIALALGLLGTGLFARDNKTSDEQAGAGVIEK